MPKYNPQNNFVLDVSVRNRNSVIFEGHVTSLTSYNDVGEFDVLPKHANFVTLIRGSIILNRGNTDERKIEVKSGLMNVSQDRVDVYLGI